MTAIYTASPADRILALRQAAALLHALWPQRVAYTRLTMGAAGAVDAICAREQSGAVLVCDRYTGELIAQSLPAPLTVLDPELFGVELDEARERALDSLADCVTASRVLQGLAGLLALPCFESLTLPELAHVLTTWAEQQGND